MNYRARLDFNMGLKRYKTGDLVGINDDQARRLVSTGFLEACAEGATNTGTNATGNPGPKTGAMSKPPAHKAIFGGKNK